MGERATLSVFVEIGGIRQPVVSLVRLPAYAAYQALPATAITDLDYDQRAYTLFATTPFRVVEPFQTKYGSVLRSLIFTLSKTMCVTIFMLLTDTQIYKSVAYMRCHCHCCRIYCLTWYGRLDEK